MDMSLVIICVVLGLAVLLILAGVVAVFKQIKAGSASIKFWGIEVSGIGGAVLLVVGLVLIFAGWQWNKDRETKTATVGDLARAASHLSSRDAEIKRLASVAGVPVLDSVATDTSFTFAPVVQRELFDKHLSPSIPIRYFTDKSAYMAVLTKDTGPSSAAQ